MRILGEIIIYLEVVLIEIMGIKGIILVFLVRVRLILIPGRCFRVDLFLYRKISLVCLIVRGVVRIIRGVVRITRLVGRDKLEMLEMRRKGV